MKDLFERTDWKRWLQLFGCVLIVMIVLRMLGWDVVLMAVFHALSPLLFSCLIVFLFEPFVEKLPFPRGISCSLVYFGFLGLLVLGIGMMVPLVMEQGSQLLGEAGRLREQLAATEFFHWAGQLDWHGVFTAGYEAAMRATRSAVDRLSFFGVRFLGAYFIALDMEAFGRILKKRLPSYQHWLLFYKTSSRVVYHYLRGLALDLLFLMITVSVLLLIFSVPNAVFYAIMLALFNLIPYLGATVGQIVILLAQYFATGQIPWVLGVLLWLIQQIEANWVQPLIFKKVMNLRPVYTLIALLAGGCFFGMIGIILAPILAAIVQLAYRSYLFAKCTETVGTWETVWYNFDSFENDDEEE